MGTPAAPKVVELFAGVGGFRVALERSGWQTVWASQWEPSTKAQHAFDCYARNFGLRWDGENPHLRQAVGEGCTAVNEDISLVLDQIDASERDAIPDHDLLVGGFPCQDYSVAKTLNQSKGIEGKKGVLWWSIHRILEAKEPRFVFLENVDRLLKSPADQRGRDFAIILACLSDLGYRVEWRVANAADYGFPQRRRRVYIVGERTEEGPRTGALQWILREGILPRALPVLDGERDDVIPLTDLETASFELGDPYDITKKFGWGNKVSSFLNAGFMQGRRVWTRTVTAAPLPEGRLPESLGQHLIAEADVPESYFIPEDRVATWAYLKGAKREERVAANGHRYWYSEGGIAFPDPTDQPSRTILTGEGGTAPSRFKHVIRTESGRLRRLVPEELERLNGFEPGWTAGMPDGRRAFMMGNALVVGMVERVGQELALEVGARLERRVARNLS